ncbi:MAG: cytochrome c oxidase assembly protein, partial [Flavipsychrobacter sp.]
MRNIFTYWHWDPLIIVAMVLLSAAYFWLWQWQLSKKVIPFAIAIFLLVVVLLSSLQLLSASYLFSVHMAVHVLLLLVIAPLLVFSLPVHLPSPLQRFLSFLSHRPALSWFVGVGIMWFWHVPAIFNSMNLHHNASHMLIHHLETISLLISGMVFSYPIV